MSKVKIYFEEKAKAEKEVSILLRKHGVGFRHGSIVDAGKQGWLISPAVKKQIEDIRAEAENFKPWKQPANKK